MSFLLRKKRHSEGPPALALASRLASLQVTQQQSRWHSSSQAIQQPQPVGPWSAHAPPFDQLPSPFFRESHALSASATSAGNLFLFGGYVHGSPSPSNDLYMFSTRDFSTTLLKTSGDAPNPRYGHRAVLTSTTYTLLIWGGTSNLKDKVKQNHALDDSLYSLNLGTSVFSFVIKTRSS